MSTSDENQLPDLSRQLQETLRPRSTSSPTTSTAGGSSSPKPKPSQSCDACSLERTRCSRGEPCARCEKRGRQCTYNRILLRAGPPTHDQRRRFAEAGVPYETFRSRLENSRQRRLDKISKLLGSSTSASSSPDASSPPAPFLSQSSSSTPNPTPTTLSPSLTRRLSAPGSAFEQGQMIPSFIPGISPELQHQSSIRSQTLEGPMLPFSSFLPSGLADPYAASTSYDAWNASSSLSHPTTTRIELIPSDSEEYRSYRGSLPLSLHSDERPDELLAAQHLEVSASG